jgi:parallel beta-helix repeat protein
MNADSNVLKQNHAEDNDVTGFEVGNSGNNLLEANRSVRNGHSGFSLSTDSLSNTLKRNVADANDVDGFFILDGVMGTSFIDNEAHRNGAWGIEDAGIRHGEGGTDNTYAGNYCTANGIAGSIPSGLCQEEPVGLVDTSRGMWHLHYGEGAMSSFFYGNPGDVPFLGDWDCDGNATPGLFRTSDAYAYLRNSNSQGIADIKFFFGDPSDIPLAGDFNGDGCDTLSIYRPSEARFYIVNELGENDGGLGAADFSFLFGNVGDKPVVGDWDGNGVDEIGLHRETTGFFYYRNTLTTGTADGQFFFGDPGDRFVAGDWGIVDGADTPAMFRPSDITFYFRHTLTQGNADSSLAMGGTADWVPVSGSRLTPQLASP